MTHDPFDFDSAREMTDSAVAVLEPIPDEHDGRAQCAADAAASRDAMDPVPASRRPVRLAASRQFADPSFEGFAVAGSL